MRPEAGMNTRGRSFGAAPFQQFVARLTNRWQEDAAILHRRGQLYTQPLSSHVCRI